MDKLNKKIKHNKNNNNIMERAVQKWNI